MTTHARSLLEKMVTALENGHENEFDEFELDARPIVVQELINIGCVGRKNNILQSIYVLRRGYDQIRP